MKETATIGGDTMVREESKTAKSNEFYLHAPARTVTYTGPMRLEIAYATPKKKVVAIVPARGNSKRVPRKNMKLLGNKPLIQYTLDAALNAKSIETVFVTTEDDEIGDFCFNYGNGKVRVIRRPAYLSRDDVQNDEVTLQAYRVIQEKGYEPDTLVLLQPTSPFRSSDDVDGAVSLYLGNSPLKETVVAVYRDYKFHWAEDVGHIYESGHNAEKRLGKQWIKDSEGLYAENGAVYVFDAARFGAERNVRMSPFIPYVMSEERSLDIDTEFDWLVAEQLVAQGFGNDK